MKFLVDQPWAAWPNGCASAASTPPSCAWPRINPGAGRLQPQTHILTRQAACQRLKRPDLLVLAASEPEGQLTEVIRRLHLTPRHLKPPDPLPPMQRPLVPLNGTWSRAGFQSMSSSTTAGSMSAPVPPGLLARQPHPGNHRALRDQLEQLGTGAPTRRNNAGSFPAL